MIPAVNLNVNASKLSTSIFVMVAQVPTVSVIIPDWILALVIAKSVAKPAVTLISSIPKSLTSN